MIKTVQIIVSGKVQGVCYRASAQKIARQLQIDGWVKNLPDGRVEIRAQGDAQMLEQLIAWCHKGPVFARVNQVIITESNNTAMAPGFIIT
jgi:acylphosphatase